MHLLSLKDKLSDGMMHTAMELFSALFLSPMKYRRQQPCGSVRSGNESVIK